MFLVAKSLLLGLLLILIGLAFGGFRRGRWYRATPGVGVTDPLELLRAPARQAGTLREVAHRGAHLAARVRPTL